MVKSVWIITLGLISMMSFGQIIADHTVVDSYDDIPQEYLDEVKKMLVDMGGESHSAGYRIGLELLELLNPDFQVQTYYEEDEPAYTDQNLRLGSTSVIGEHHIFAADWALSHTKSVITDQYNTGNPYTVMGFAWCYDMTYMNSPGGTEDPVYEVRWAGITDRGPQGSLIWGLDAEDYILTGNTVCMDTYLQAIEEYNI